MSSSSPDHNLISGPIYVGDRFEVRFEKGKHKARCKRNLVTVSLRQELTVRIGLVPIPSLS